MDTSKNIQLLNKGLVTDLEPSFQPEGSYRFALNAVTETDSGDLGNISNERGTVNCFQIPDNFVIIGTKLLYDDKIIFFMTDNTHSCICQGDLTNCSYQVLVNADCLNFRTNNSPISALVKTLNDCDTILYFTDGKNPYRSINLSQLDFYVNDGYSVTNPSLLHPNDYPDLGWNCSLFDFFLGVRNIPEMSIDILETGGDLKVGTKQFGIRLKSQDGIYTDILYVSQNVVIYDEPSSSNYDIIDGAINTTQDADNGVSTVKKSVKIRLTNLDPVFKEYQIVVFEANNGLGEISDVYYLTPKVIPSSGNDNFYYTGYTSQINHIGTLNEALNISIKLTTVQHHEQYDGRLLLANVKEKTYDWSKFQRKASKIIGSWTTKTILRQYHNNTESAAICDGSSTATEYSWLKFGDTTSQKEAVYYFNQGHYLYDEIYAFGIVFQLGEIESPVFPIIGRPANVASVIRPNDGVIIDFNNSACVNINNQYSLYGNEHNRNTDVISAIDTELLEIVASGSTYTQTNQVPLEEVKHLGFTTETDDIGYGAGRIPRWKLFNTALTISLIAETQEDGVIYANPYGTFGYHQNDNYFYPTIKTCDGESYWGTDYWGNNIEGENVRHFRFPDTASIHNANFVDKEKSKICGVIFGNIEYPVEYANEITGYRIVRAERTEEHKTILNKGVAANAYLVTVNAGAGNPVLVYWQDPLCSPQDLRFGSNDGEIFIEEAVVDAAVDANIIHDEYNKYSKVLIYESPEDRFQQKANVGSYYKSENIFKYCQNANGHGDVDARFVQTSAECVASMNYTNLDLHFLNRKVQRSAFVNPLTSDNFGSGLVVSDYFNLKNSYYSAVFTVLEDAVNLLEGSPNIIPNENIGEYCPTLSYYNYHYVSNKVLIEPYGNVLNLNYISCHTNLLNDNYTGYVGGGDSYISNYWFKKVRCGHNAAGGFAGSYAGGWSIDNGDIRHIQGMMCESSFPVHFRHSYKADIQSYYYPHEFSYGYRYKHVFTLMDSSDVNLISFADINFSFITSRWKKASIEQYNFNPDFGRLSNDIKKYFCLPSSYNFCSDCIGEFPNRIYYSNKSFSEDYADNYRTILANNYKDYFNEEGPITNIFTVDSHLYAHFENTLAYVPLNSQQLKTDVTTLYVGTGDFLSIPAKKILTTDYSYLGSTDKFATKLTEFGVLFVNQKSGKVFLMNQGQPKEISAIGNKKFFDNNGQISLLSQIKNKFDIDYPLYSNTIDEYGVGYITTYDPYLKRLIICKKDYKLLPEIYNTIKLLGDPSITVGDFIYDNVNYKFGIIQSNSPLNIIYVPLSVSQFFENKSWTLSFSLVNEQWVSFHSYTPSWLFNNSKTFYSSAGRADLNPRYLQKHNFGPYQSYYGFIYPYVIEFIDNNAFPLEKYYDSLTYVSKGEYFSSLENDYVDVEDYTFDKLIVYNRNQSSGELNLMYKQDPYQFLTETSDNVLINRTEDYWKVNKIRDYSIDRNLGTVPLMTSNWNNINGDFNLNNEAFGYIDKVVNLNAIDKNKNLYQLRRFKDKWLAVRLMLTNEKQNGDYKLSTTFTNFNTDVSIR